MMRIAHLKLSAMAVSVILAGTAYAAPATSKFKGTLQVPATDIKWTAIPINAEISPIMGDANKG